MKILIIDDSKAMRTFLASLVQELSADSTVEAVDGRDGLDKLIKNDPRAPFDLALVDWDMPRMNGLEFVQFVRRNHDYDELKLMMVTTNNSMEKLTQALEAGANDFLMKPVSKESLAEKLQILGLIE
jgi:two-component system, chemotaxis family, chemotaxis protein CheY